MEITPAMRAHRALRQLARFRSWRGEGEILDPGEMPLGFYENAPGRVEGGVLFTDRALHVSESIGWATYPYANMLNVDLEAGRKSAARLDIQLRDGGSVMVLFCGEDQARGTRDIFSVWTFLRHVLADMRVKDQIGHKAVRNA